MDNSKNRLNDVFFYGLYMDKEILKSKGVTPRNPRKGELKNTTLAIGNMATLLRQQGTSSYGMVYSLTHSEIDMLYRGSGLDDYVPEVVTVTTDDGDISALTCVLLIPPAPEERNDDYLKKLCVCMKSLGLPISFV